MLLRIKFIFKNALMRGDKSFVDETYFWYVEFTKLAGNKAVKYFGDKFTILQ